MKGISSDVRPALWPPLWRFSATSTTVTVDGALSGEGIEPVQTCCIQALSKGNFATLLQRASI
jgi:hypothetical protein